MSNLTSDTQALPAFGRAATAHTHATATGNYRHGNKCFTRVTQCAGYLQRTNQLLQLAALLDHEQAGVRLWAAGYLLPLRETEALKILKQISRLPGIVALAADLLLSEWQAGRLHMVYG